MAADETFDLVVIGAGPGGYVAALRGAQLGLKVACIEKREAMGGTCLNVGCIPSKALLESSEHFHMASHGFAEHGIKVDKVELDLKAMLARKEKIVGELTRGVGGLLKKNKVTVVQGSARITSPNAVEVTDSTGKTQSLEGRNILIASGSDSIGLPGVSFDGEKVISSTEALSLDKVPKKLLVVGAGVIGLELGSVWGRLGAEVTVIEFLPKILGPLDKQISTMAQRTFTKQGFKFHLDTKVTSVDTSGKGVKVQAETAKGETLDFEGDVLLVSIGRKPYSEGLGAAEAGVVLNGKGQIEVDKRFRTAVPSIYAIGDVIDGPMLAHKASEEGVAVAEIIAGQNPHITYEAIPWIVYTWPEVAWVGHGEEELKAMGQAYKVGTFPFMANARAKTMGETDGLVKILSDPETDRLLGVLIFGPRASDVIAEAGLAFEFGGSAEDLAMTIHAHPTLSEAIKEAALAVDKRALHI